MSRSPLQTNSMIAYDVSALHVTSLNSEQFSLISCGAGTRRPHLPHQHIAHNAAICCKTQSSTAYLPQDRLPQDHHIQAHHLQDNACYKTTSLKCTFYCNTSHQTIFYMHSLRFNWPFPVALHHLPSHHLPPHHLPFAACGCITTEMPPGLF